MERLTLDTLKEVQEEVATVSAAVIPTWLDYLPHGCELPELWRTGKSLDDCLDIIGQSKVLINKKCRHLCRTDCKACHFSWAKAAAAMVLQKQVDKAFAGDPAMLTWYGKAVLRQQEPQSSDEQIIPSIINITGLDADQEKEIDSLRRQLDEAQRRLQELEAKYAKDS